MSSNAMWHAYQAYLDQNPYSIPTIAFCGETLDKIQSYEFDETDWSKINNDFTLATQNLPAVAALSYTSIAFYDVAVDELRKYALSSGTWSLDGSALTITIAGSAYTAMTAMSDSRVAWTNPSAGKLRAYDFNGSTWALKGSEFSLAADQNPACAALTESTVALLIGGSSSTLQTYSFNGSTWSTVGNALAVTRTSGTASASMAALSETRVVVHYHNGSALVLQTYDFDGSDWVATGNARTTTPAALAYITALSATRIGYFENQNDGLKTLDFDESDWTVTGNAKTITPVGAAGLASLSYSVIF